MPGGPYPTTRAKFNDYIQLVCPYLNANAARLQISGANLTAVNTLKPLWDALWAKYIDPDKKTKTVVKNTDTMIKQWKTLLSSIYKDIPQSVLTEQDRVVLGLKLRDPHPTRVAVPEGAPTISIDKMMHLKHILKITDPANPHTQAKPKGVRETEIQIAVSDEGVPKTVPVPVPVPAEQTPAPAPFPQESDWHTLVHTGKFLYTAHFTDAQLKATAYYRARYLNTRGETGDWGNTVNGVVS
ncbi:MAG: hypothetical protein HY841_02220 [Bacteroidetes bacterium]|nr:hypothetical protein [Bacteroidota bacterium]